MKTRKKYTSKPIETRSVVPNINPSFWLPGTTRGVSAENVEAKPYQFHWIVYSCCQAIVRNVARLEKYLYEESTETNEYSHEVLKLLGSPNPFMTRTTFFESIILNMMLPACGDSYNGGQCFIICEGAIPGQRVNLTKGEIPASLWPYSAAQVTPWYQDESNKKTWKGWKVRLSNSTEERYAPNEIIRIAGFNPYNWLEGLPTLSPAAVALANDLKADLWNSRNYENDAVPAGLLTSDQLLTEAQAKEVNSRWYQKYGGPGNQRRIAVLGAGLKFQALNPTPRDMEFTKGKDINRKSMLAVWGLNEIALGNYEQINFATIVEGRKMLWHDTYLPLDEKINEALTSQWIRFVDAPRKTWCLRSDLTKVQALQADIEKSSVVANRFYKMGAPFTFACQLANIALPSDTLTKYPWLVEKPVAPNQFDALYPTDAPAAPEKAVKKTNRLSDIELSKISESYIERVLQPGESFLLKRLYDHLVAQRNAMMDKVDAWQKKNTTKAAIPASVNPEEFLLNLQKETQKLVDIYRTATGEQLKRERQKLVEELGAKNVKWNVTNPMIDVYVDQRKHELLGIEKLTFKKVEDRVAASVKEAMENNETVAQLAARIKADIGYVEEVRKNQSKTIARTETGIISSEARHQTMRQAGIEYHQWVTADDEKVRDSHRAVNGVVVRVGEKFPIVNMAYPMDPDGDLGDIVNCRCVAIAVANEDGSDFNPEG